MPKYIDADNLKTILEERRDTARRLYGNLGGAVSGCIKLLDQQPAADVEPVVHGRWIPGKAVYSEYNEGRLVARYYDQWVCSVCNYVINDQHYSQISYKRCPECGAHMDAEPPKEEEDDISRN